MRKMCPQEPQESDREKMKTQEQQLDYALGIIQNKLTEWGLDDWLGFRTPEVMRLSVDGAINLLDLINTLTSEIDRLEKIIGEWTRQ